MDPAPQPQAPRMCPRHGVVLDPFGHCVICRRADAEVDDDPSGARTAITALLLLALVVAGALVYRGLVAKREPPVVARVAEAPPLPAPPAEDLSSAQEQARASQQKAQAEEQRVAVEKEMRRVPIRVYTTKRCELCRTATEFLTSKGYEHTEIDVDASPEGLEALKALTPKPSVPTIVVGEEVIVGFGQGAVLGAVYRAAGKKVR